MLLSDEEISFEHFTRDGGWGFTNTVVICGFVYILCFGHHIILWSDYTDLKKKCILTDV
jgi:hypothetical protein